MPYLRIALIIMIFTGITNAQNNNYDKLWEEVTKLENDGLTQSASKVVDRIWQQAEKENNEQQLIKCLIYQSKYTLILQEDAELNIIHKFKNKINKSKVPTKNLLEYMLADLYWQYFKQNRYKFYNRSTTDGKPSDDFRTWDLSTLFNEIHSHFQKALHQPETLQKTSLNAYESLLIKVPNSELYRPTLFDLLAHGALDFYKTPESSINQPADKFLIDRESFFEDAKTFSELKITTTDTTSLQHNALKIYQQLIKFHLNDTNKLALVDADIQRLQFVYQNAVKDNKDQLLKASLEKAIGQNTGEISGLYQFELAALYYKQGNTYNPQTNNEHRWKIKESLEICNTISAINSNSLSSKKAEVLKQQILQTQLSIKTEQFLPLDKNTFSLVTYRNIETLDFSAIKISQEQLEIFNKTYRKDNQYSFIKALKPTETWQAKLPNENDYQQHSTEIVIPKLENGLYIVFAERANDPETFAFSTIQLTDLALTSKWTQTEEIFQIINRNNGKPIVGAAIDISYKEQYNLPLKYQTYTTDKNGEFKLFKSDKQYRDLNFVVSYQKQTAYFGNSFVGEQSKPGKKEIDYQSFIFTDRSIYRPGQTVHFKAIVIKTENDKSEVVPNQIVEIILYDTNDDELTTLQLKTNEFGSVSGSFILPSNTLTGEFSIEIDADDIDIYHEVYFSVEEYKRPKFEANFQPITETFRVNDSIKVTGEAKAYAGSNITNAKVQYRVVRTVQFPRWYGFRPPYYAQSQEITFGETQTDANGKFDVMFKAIPDESVDKTHQPVFTYEVTADITDINGETRSTQTIVKVGYHAMTAAILVNSELEKGDKNHDIAIQTNNLNGQFVPAKGNIKIYKLQEPETVTRPRPWLAPDLPSLTEAEFKTLFPHDIYSNPNSAETPKTALVFEQSFDTGNSKSIKLGNIKKWLSGDYVIELESEDNFNQTVKTSAFFKVFGKDDKTVSEKKLFEIYTNNNVYQPDDFVMLTIGSAANITVTIDIEKRKQTINSYVIELNNSKKTIAIPVNKGDEGGFSINYSYAAFNSFDNGSLVINVPYPSTDLNIETLVFRDKLQPGTNETWQFKIKGPKGEKVSAELLASMYDASLDQFKSHNWTFNPISKPTYYAKQTRWSQLSFGTKNLRVYLPNYSMSYPQQSYDALNWFGFYFGFNSKNNYRLKNMAQAPVQLNESTDGLEMAIEELENNPRLDEVVVTGYGSPITKSIDSIQNELDFSTVKIRKNLEETAFFFPHLQTDADGNVSFSFTSPEALTQWKLQLLAHTKNLESSVTTLQAVTQKELMVIPNAPRFLRHGDQITISAKIANLSTQQLTGDAVLQLFDAFTEKSIDLDLGNINAVKSFTVDANGNTNVSWDITIPDTVDAVHYKIIAKSGDFSDGEQNALPVLSNRMLVTETLPMWVKSNESRTFVLDKLKNNTSNTLKHHKLTLEITSNPAWYAVQALPYLMEYPYDCNEQIFSRFYANALASFIANSNPRIKEVFNQWASQDALISNLEKNEELKQIIIQETPWLNEAQSETEQKKRIALLFDLNKMTNELEVAQRKLENNQLGNGAWSWFEGGRENRFITQHIITGFGHLKHLNVSAQDNENMISQAVSYLDNAFVKEYHDLTKFNANVDLSKDHLSYTQLHYLYMRSFFPDIEKSKEVKDITNYYLGQIEKYWLKRSLYAKGLMALITHRAEKPVVADKILKSLKENAIISDELGMYWKENTASWYWYQAPVETQALMVEVFSEIENNTKTIDNLKIWLLKNKQTNSWKTTKSTADAVYALLLQGSDWLSITDAVEVTVGNQSINPATIDAVKVEAGTGYFKTSWNTNDIKPEMAEVSLKKKGEGIAWGSLYWQYFEDLDKITSAETGLKLTKTLFLKSNTAKGEVITEIKDNSVLKVGDLIKVRIELRSDRDLEFIHLKDMRAAGLEPVNVISSYKWQDGLGYYEATKDAATNFFIDFLPKGIYVFEYDLRVNNSGNMSNGITTIQSMYAPEFSSHSEGIRINVKGDN
ncbi:alpha-2-macroglobulin [Paucihalobacter ruber]|uniref:Alpha-2-macroglobulin n=1 Tax=Paucihalobacter ruber TaxID=2567861 RepID=A0A506PK11_9FLAO|nr:MG2 domain-containing protein [Paucihalobacter ruber]TPV34196.1 alpha-2-macroglobulin [Paucihalobacter ruber]